MIQAFANIFRIRDLRNKVFFTLGVLVIYRIGFWIPLLGVDQSELAKAASIRGSEWIRAIAGIRFDFLGRIASAVHDLRSWNYAVHHGEHHLSVVASGGSITARTQERGDVRPAESDGMDSLRDGWTLPAARSDVVGIPSNAEFGSATIPTRWRTRDLLYLGHCRSHRRKPFLDVAG